MIDFVELGWLSFCYLGLLAAALVSVVHNTVLLYRFSARLTRGAEPERHKNWRKGAGRYLVGRVLAALLFVLTIVWTFAGSAMEKSRHGSIPLEDYTAPLPFATLDDYAGSPPRWMPTPPPRPALCWCSGCRWPRPLSNMKPTARPARMGCVVHYM